MATAAQTSQMLREAVSEEIILMRALQAIYEAGRMSDNSRAQYMAEIAKTALDEVRESAKIN